MRNKFLTIVLIFSALVLCSCKKEEKFNTDKLKVCTSFYTVYDFVNKIGGDKVEIINIIPPGAEPHEFELSPRDLVTLSKADVLICNGLGMERFIGKVKESVDKLKIVEIADGLELLGEDPHVWLNPQNVKQELKNIRDVLINLDSNNREYYEKNYNKYAKEIENLDKEYEDRLSNCTKNEIIVTHKAFGYLCYRYGLRQVALKGVLDEGEPSMQKMTEIIKFIKDNDIKTVFYETEKDKKIMKAIAKETGAGMLKLETLENITKKDIENGRDYFGVMRSNLDNLVNALC